MDISLWTKQDFIDFDNRRAELFAPTNEEAQEQTQANKENLVSVVQAKLKVYNIDFTGDETDFTNLYTLYIKWDWTTTNKSMSEWIWTVEELDKTIEYLTTEKNTLEWFCNFVLQYE